MIKSILISLLFLFNPVLINADIDIVNDYDIELFNISSVDDLRRFLNYSVIDKREYENNTYNCVNFSSDLIKELEYYGFESANTRMHRENGTAITDDMHMIIAVKLDDKIVFVEPQTDTILTYEELENHYSDNGFTDIVIYDLLGMSTILSFNGWMSDSTKKMFEVEI